MSEGERIARLEARADGHDDDITRVVDDIGAIRISLSNIDKTLSGYRGFWFGVTFSVGTLAGLIGAGLTAVWHRLFP
jgi:hypothetical protein